MPGVPCNGIGGRADLEVNVARADPLMLFVLPSMKPDQVLSDYQKNPNDSVLSAPLDSAPSPWQLRGGQWHDGSTLAVGFSSLEQHLLCTDFETRWLVSTESGEILFDDSNTDPSEWWDPASLSITGFGSISNEKIPTSGPCGHAAGFHFATDDGWKICNLCSPYFQPHICLVKPGEQLYSRAPQFTKIAMPATELIVFGFTPSGKVMIVVERDEFLIWCRPKLQ